MNDGRRSAVIRAIAFALCFAAIYGRADAQPRPSVLVELISTDSLPDVEVSVEGLLSDRRFLNAMESGFPLYVEYHVALRNSRSAWFDDIADEFSWEYVVFFDPVREIYVVEARGVTEQLSSVGDLRSRVAQRYRIGPFRAGGPGRYYYSVTVNARTLSDSDVDEVFAWLEGGSGDSTSFERPGFLTRTARRLLVRVAPLPRVTLENRSSDFRLP
jgi:hypothetical protein